jgi:predicted ArsR family transcriptional regulator
MESFEHRLEATGALAGDIRRALYIFIREQRRPVGREEAAVAVGISPKLAAFHLDVLVEKGLLVASYMRLSARRGPGAGRPSKVYKPSETEISVSIPFRSYDIVGEMLLDALESSGEPLGGITDAARQRGTELGRRERPTRSFRSSSKNKSIDVTKAILTEHGYEPYRDDRGDLWLHNCPFHQLAKRSPQLVCGLNHAFIEGLLSGLGGTTLQADLDPRPGQCCVTLRDDKSSSR